MLVFQFGLRDCSLGMPCLCSSIQLLEGLDLAFLQQFDHLIGPDVLTGKRGARNDDENSCSDC